MNDLLEIVDFGFMASALFYLLIISFAREKKSLSFLGAVLRKREDRQTVCTSMDLRAKSKRVIFVRVPPRFYLSFFFEQSFCESLVSRMMNKGRGQGPFSRSVSCRKHHFPL